MLRARILIHNKSGVFDPEGQAIREGLTRLGFENMDGLRIGRAIEVCVRRGNESDVRAEIDRMCKDLLVNPVLEDYSIEFLDDE